MMIVVIIITIIIYQVMPISAASIIVQVNQAAETQGRKEHRCPLLVAAGFTNSRMHSFHWQTRQPLKPVTQVRLRNNKFRNTRK